jgi:hypothetical protein
VPHDRREHTIRVEVTSLRPMHGEVLTERARCQCGATLLPRALALRDTNGEMTCAACWRRRGIRLVPPWSPLDPPPP